MGRKMNALKDDGRPLTGFVISLRALWEEAGAPPTLSALADKTGYTQPRLSELFNAKKIPSDELLQDVVHALNGDTKVWLDRLRVLREAEKEFQAVAAREGDTLEAKIARLEHENKKLLALTRHPGSVIAQARAADELSAFRAREAEKLERHARSLLARATDQFRQLHEHIPAVQRQADTIIAEARAEADRRELEGRNRQQEIIDEANARGDEIIAKAVKKANELEQHAAERAKEHGDRTFALLKEKLSEVDQLRIEAQLAVEQAEAQRSTMERRAKIEIERFVREAQKQLELAGAARQAQTLETLLLDFNINGSHETVRGRHARRPAPAQSRPLPTSARADADASPSAPTGRRWGFPRPRS
ncbi:helix-turn-helix domain-containing protein [Streptomyces sp. NPDC127197]|uniref:helix-turn-helix domain-containing protein n=1 Tax=Streptomyces sp. NPDC127197 TaxID=3345388 RepID=UPI0036402740